MADSNKTEQATPRHRNKARQRGQVPRSKELSSTLVLAATAVLMCLTVPEDLRNWERLFRCSIDYAASGTDQIGQTVLYWTFLETMRWVLPLAVCGLTVAALAGYAQGGIIFAPEALSPNAERISPAGKFQQMLSLTSLSGILKSLIPFTAITIVACNAIRQYWSAILLSSYTAPLSAIHLLGTILLETGWKIGMILLLWSGVDYLIVWFKSESDLKMSRQDIREELKESEGNPHTKSRMRRMQRQHRRKLMVKAAETATVVITNPTHYAVALRYAPEMVAPVVVAKGLDLLAEKIKRIAHDCNIPLIENRLLAQSLYKGTEVGDAIPPALYHTVAEILVVIYRAQSELRQQEAKRRSGKAVHSTGEMS